jgi:hypothetical protein
MEAIKQWMKLFGIVRYVLQLIATTCTAYECYMRMSHNILASSENEIEAGQTMTHFKNKCVTSQHGDGDGCVRQLYSRGL